MGQHILILQSTLPRSKGKRKKKGWTLPLVLDLSHALKEVRVKTLKDGQALRMRGFTWKNDMGEF